MNIKFKKTGVNLELQIYGVIVNILDMSAKSLAAYVKVLAKRVLRAQHLTFLRNWKL